MENTAFCPLCLPVEANPGTQVIKVCAECAQKLLSKYTCFSCKDSHACIYAWDGYNKNGDCLGIK